MSSQYNIKNIKTLRTSNGVALTANLYDGKTFVASIEDRGDGGSLWIYWDLDRELHQHQIQQWWKQNCEGHWTAGYTESDNILEHAMELLIEHAQLNKDVKKNIVFRSGENTYKWRDSDLSDLPALMRIAYDYPDAECWNVETQKWSMVKSFIAEQVSA